MNADDVGVDEANHIRRRYDAQKSVMNQPRATIRADIATVVILDAVRSQSLSYWITSASLYVVSEKGDEDKNSATKNV